MAKKKKLFEFGRVIPGLKIDGKDAPYPVVNERDARAGAGVMLLLGFVAFVYAFFLKEYFAINILVILFLIEFLVRLADPSKAPFYLIGSFIVRKQRPEYVGAAQKRFAWGLGLAMATTVSILIYVVGYRGYVNLGFCIVCLGLMWLESAFGICVGCKMYYKLMDWGWIKKPKVMPACPGGVCAIDFSKKK